MENVEFNLKCLKTLDSKQGAVRAVRFNGEFHVCHMFDEYRRRRKGLELYVSSSCSRFSSSEFVTV